jgi:hypothetical protein
MEKARYHRDQAALCLQMARLISDPIAARLMRMAAARHFEQVAELDALSTDPSGTLRGDDKGRDDFSDSFYYRVIRTRIGEALRSQLVPTEPHPGKLFEIGPAPGVADGHIEPRSGERIGEVATDRGGFGDDRSRPQGLL